MGTRGQNEPETLPSDRAPFKTPSQHPPACLAVWRGRHFAIAAGDGRPLENANLRPAIVWKSSVLVRACGHRARNPQVKRPRGRNLAIIAAISTHFAWAEAGIARNKIENQASLAAKFSCDSANGRCQWVCGLVCATRAFCLGGCSVSIVATWTHCAAAAFKNRPNNNYHKAALRFLLRCAHSLRHILAQSRVKLWKLRVHPRKHERRFDVGVGRDQVIDRTAPIGRQYLPT